MRRVSSAARLGFSLRWLYVAAWAFVSITYLDWLFEPLGDHSDFEQWWRPYKYSQLVFAGARPQALIDFQNRGIDGLLGWKASYSDFRTAYFVVALTICLALAISAAAFLWTGHTWTRELPAVRKPRVQNIAAASLMTSWLSVGFVALLLGWLGWWEEFVELPIQDFVKWKLIGPPNPNAWFGSGNPSAVPGLTLMLACWVGSFALLTLTSRRSERYWQFEWMTRLILIGAAALLLATFVVPQSTAPPTFGLGSHLALSSWRYYEMSTAEGTARFFASSLLLWASGCRIVLLFQLNRFEKMRLLVSEEPICYACEYDLRGTIDGGGARCPECGAGISRKLLTGSNSRGAPQS